MAKNKKRTTTRTVAVRTRPRREGPSVTGNSAQKLDAAALGHANMLYDPCGAELVPSVYPGDQGYYNRFVANATIGTSTGETAWALIIKPGNQVGSVTGATASSAALTINYTAANFPGSQFLAGNAGKVRAAASCVTIRPNAAPNNATGTIHFGNVSASSMPNGGTTNYDTLIQYCTESVSSSQAVMAPLEVKWCPGGFDDRYNFQGSASDDDSDRNVLIIVGVGFPAASGAQWRQTAILEWTPRATAGIAFDATNVSPSQCDKECVLRYLKQRNTDWWWSLGKSTFKVAKTMVQGYYSGGPLGAMSKTAKVIGQMITR
jgi:hypothetical protein